MDAVSLTEYMLKHLREKKADYGQMLTNGTIENMEDYRFIVGQIRGLQYCEDELRSAMKGIIHDD